MGGGGEETETEKLSETAQLWELASLSDELFSQSLKSTTWFQLHRLSGCRAYPSSLSLSSVSGSTGVPAQ